MRVVGVVALFVAGLFGAVGVGSAASGANSTTTDVPTVPGSPTIRSATAGANGITVLWNAPSSTGGSPLTGFRLYRAVGKDNPTLLATLGLVDSYAVGATPGSLFQPYQATPVGSWPEAVAIGDVNGDGRNDVVMTTSYYFDPTN